MKARFALLLTLAGLLGCLGFPFAPLRAETVPVSRRNNVQGTGGGSYAPQFSGDGSSLLFLSQARNLTTNDAGGGGLNVYVYSFTNAQIHLVSRPNSGMYAYGSSGMAAISSNAQFVAFESLASNLAAGDTNESKDIFLRDLNGATTTLMSVATNGTGNGETDSYNPVMTPDGRWVAFEGRSKNIASGATGNAINVFLRDRLTGTTMAVSRGPTGTVGHSFSPAITPDGQAIAFVSTGLLVPSTGGNALGDVYVRRLTSGTIYPASTNIPLPRRCFFPQISDDGERVLFKVAGDYLIQTQVCLFDKFSGTTTIVSSNANDNTLPVLSGNGRLVVTENNGNVFLWNLEAGTNLLISVRADGAGPGNAPSYGPVVSRDFTRVAFLSEATNLTTNVCNGKPQIYVRDLIQGVTRLVSSDTNGTGSADFTGAAPVISPAGDLVAFDSSARNLALADFNEGADIFLYSWTNNVVQLISRPAAGTVGKTAAALSFAGPACVSSDGRYIAFNTLDKGFYPFAVTNPLTFVVWDTWQDRNIVTNLISTPPSGNASAFLPPVIGSRPPVLSGDGRTLVYVVQTYDNIGPPSIESLYQLDLASGNQRLIGQNRNPSSNTVTHLNPSISDDGRYIVFQSDATSLSGNIPDTNGQTDVFLFDSLDRTTSLVSVATAGNVVGNGSSSNAFITPNGKWIFFTSISSNLCTNLPSSYSAINRLIYARDRAAGKTYALGNLEIPYSLPGVPVVDAVNRVVFFEASVTCCRRSILGFDLVTLSNVFYKADTLNPVVSPDGRYLIYKKESSNQGYLYAYDLGRSKETLITPRTSSLDLWGEQSANVSISPNGRYIVFSSTATNLVVGDNNDQSDVFLHDRLLGVTTLLSVNRNGTGPGAGPSIQPVMSRDGKTVVFQSFAGDLVEGDYNNARDVFVARIGGVDSDNDGLDDDWEVAYFGDLSRDGMGDFDGDGQTDYQEFIAGTDPRNDSSILRVMTVSKLNSGPVTLLWNAVPGKIYRVQYKDDLSTNTWTELAGTVVASSSTASKQDLQPTAKRFYRVVAGGE